MIGNISVLKAKDNQFGVLFLPGRGGHGRVLMEYYYPYIDRSNTLMVAATPANFEWYPLPIGPHEQSEALSGLPHARRALEKLVKRLEVDFSLPRERIAVVGFSAGGVMAIQLAAYSQRSFAAVICHSGAILDPEDLPVCRHPYMPVILTHSKDDSCFDWYERYLPMQEALIQREYRTYEMIRETGNHTIFVSDIHAVAEAFGTCIFDDSEDLEELGFNPVS